MDNKSMHRRKKRHIICFQRKRITNDIELKGSESVLYFTIFNYCFGTNIYGEMIV
jgi:hypothetical protein